MSVHTTTEDASLLLFTKFVQCIIPNRLYLGEARAFTCDAVRRDHLVAKHNVSVIVRCIPSSHSQSSHDHAVAICAAEHLQLNVIPLEDDVCESIRPYLDDFSRIMDENKTAVVFVHCQAGVSRSASLVIAYVMKFMQLSIDDAYSYVKSRRRVVNPNERFMAELIAYGCELNDNVKDDLFDLRLHIKFQSKVRNMDNKQLREAVRKFAQEKYGFDGTIDNNNNDNHTNTILDDVDLLSYLKAKDV
eukprot:PhM_4_TR8548/c0_g1_i1/m.90596/K04459/DUSP, MKP; dual specificity MAP kinase phosphatase